MYVLDVFLRNGQYRSKSFFASINQNIDAYALIVTSTLIPNEETTTFKVKAALPESHDHEGEFSKTAKVAFRM